MNLIRKVSQTLNKPVLFALLFISYFFLIGISHILWRIIFRSNKDKYWQLPDDKNQSFDISSAY